MELKERYEQICKEYIDLFCEKQDLIFTDDSYVDFYLTFNDYYIFDVESIRYDIDNDIKKGLIIEWYHYNNERTYYINYKSFLMI